jgi:bifunctional UDP-N-acetylglucosamine pyrophosphorylase/glucosamine-1-phosphate N-acetyltransferase
MAAPEAGRDHLLAAAERQDPSQQAITGAVGEGVLCFDSDWLWANLDWLSQDDFHLSDLVALASEQGDAVIALPLADLLEVTRADDLLKLASAETEMRRRINQDWLLDGVAIVDPAATYIESGVEIGAGTVIWPNTYLQGETRIGQRCTIGPGSVIRDSSIGDGCKIELSVVEEAVMEEGSEIGPFGHLRRGAHLGPGVHMGNFGEVKNSYLGPRAKMGHMSYLGDATVGADANIGAGTITCNYDGQQKHRTVIGEGAFIGSDTMLVAPVTVGARARTGAGSVVTRDVPPDSTAYGVPARPRTKSDLPATGWESGPIPGSDMQDESDPAAAPSSEED